MSAVHVYLLVAAILALVVVSTSNQRPSGREVLFYLAAALWPVTIIAVIILALASFVRMSHHKGEEADEYQDQPRT